MSGRGEAPVRYWKPAPTLAGLVTGYHSYGAHPPPGITLREAFFPSWATIRVAMPGSRGWSLRLGPRTFDPVPAAAFVGPTSYAGYMESGGGELVGAGILPAGWAVLFGGDMGLRANRVVPLAEIAPQDAAPLVEALADGVAPDAAFDAWLLKRLEQAPPPDPRIARLMALLDDPATTRIEPVAEELGLTPRALAATTRFTFGFTPKLLLRRSRFLRALSIALSDPEGSTARLAEAGYWDRSHFLRDSHLFLGCSIREFNKRIGPMASIAMRVRTEVMGTPV